jgi:hypothetical protein
VSPIDEGGMNRRREDRAGEFYSLVFATPTHSLMATMGHRSGTVPSSDGGRCPPEV